MPQNAAKLKRYQELAELLVEKEQPNIQTNMMCSGSTKINVPDEIWLKIMSYLGNKTIFSNLSLVNKHFNSLTHDSRVIKSFNLIKTVN